MQGIVLDDLFGDNEISPLNQRKLNTGKILLQKCDLTRKKLTDFQKIKVFWLSYFYFILFLRRLKFFDVF